MDPPQVSADDRLSRVLAEYLEETDTVKGEATYLQVLRDRCLTDYPDLASELKDHFEHEDAVAGHVWERDVLPDFGRYAEVTQIGEGTFGVVYKAFDRELKRWVALKIPSFDVGTIREARRCRVEAQSMARLEHRNIVRVLDVTDYQGHPVLSMELVSGGSLDQHLERFRKNQRSLATLMVDIARGVHHAHQRGILHRDLKPSNILLDTDEHGPDHPHVSDFGLAKPMDVSEPRTDAAAHLGPGTTEYGKIVGTASYMSPEQASGRDATTLSDVYGLGGILYALLTGRPPFREESAEDTLAHVREPTRRPRLPRNINADSDHTLEAILSKVFGKGSHGPLPFSGGRGEGPRPLVGFSAD